MGQRADLLTAIRSRVDRVVSTGDRSAVLDPAALAEAWSLAQLCDAGGDSDLEARYALGWLHHYRAQFAPPDVAKGDRQLAVHWLTECFVAGQDPLPEPLLVSLAERAIPAALKILGLAQITMDPAHQTRALGLCERIVRSLPEDHPARPALLSNLGTALLMRFAHTLDPADLDEAVQATRAAVRAVPDDDPERPLYLSNMGLVLRARFERTGATTDLDEAVETLRAAVRATPEGHPGRVNRLYQLGLALGVRFERTVTFGDLDEEVDVMRTVVRTVPAAHPDRAKYQSVLGGVLRTRFERLGAPEDLDEAVRLSRAAVLAAPSDRHDRAQGMSTLSTVLLTRFGHTGESGDLDEAVEMARAAVPIAPDNYPAVDRAMLVFGLGTALLLRFEHTEAPADLDEAVESIRHAIRITPADYPLRATYQAILGDALRKRSERDGAADEDREEQLSLWRRTVEERTAPPRLRIMTAREAARRAAASDPALAAALLERAVLMLPELAPRRLQRGDQQYVLGSLAAGLAAEAASLALADPTVNARERPARALRLAEAGRAVLLSQALETRSDLTDLRDQHPGLAERFCELRDLLDRDQATTAAPGTAGRTEATGRERHQVARELEAVLGRIRDCEGFATFGLPPTLDELRAEAVHGPVVTFNISRYRSDALILTREGVTSCPLPQLTEKAVIDQVNTFYQALEDTTAPDDRRISAQQTLHQVLEWLWEAAAEPVLSALGDALHPVDRDKDGKDGKDTEDGDPRLWWAPGGILGLLPLHAAGFHTAPGQDPHPRTVLDRVISSYTPTIRALRYARRPRPRTTDGLRSLIVAMPTTPGLGRLRHVPEEAARLQSLLPSPLLLAEPESVPDDTPLGAPSGHTPTLATVLDHLPKSAIAHFACHGAGDRTDPSRSRLFLHDHATTPLTVSALAQVNLGHARLAYLSACSTADPGRADLLDESIHLTSAFQLAGFPHVVGTLWPIDDQLAVTVAESFYTHLTTGPPQTLDPDRSAAALHHATRTLRDRYPRTPSLWAAYLHTGA